MKTCGICGKELDHGAVVHRTCLAVSKADYDKPSGLTPTKEAKLLEENARLRAENEKLIIRINKIEEKMQ